MKYRFLLSILCLFLIFSAGCVSFGAQTTDIMMGNTSVGTVTLIPNADGSVSADISLFGMTFTKDGMTEAEAEKLAGSAAEGEIFAGLGIQGIPENAGTPSDLDEFLESIANMPLSNTGSGSTAGLDFGLAAENAAASAAALESLLHDMFGI